MFGSSGTTCVAWRWAATRCASSNTCSGISIVIVSIILDIVAYSISKTINSIAIATLITNIIWFIIGEYEFKEYRLKMKDYIYLVLILIAFLMCGYIESAIIGIAIYCILMLMFMILLERQCCIDIFKENKKEIIQIWKK